MSPEQITGGQLTHKSDIWSLAVTIHEACSFIRAFDGEDWSQVEWAIQNMDPPPLTLYKYTDGLWFTQQKYSDKFDYLIRWMLRKDPERRPTAREVIKHIEAKWGRFSEEERLSFKV